MISKSIVGFCTGFFGSIAFVCFLFIFGIILGVQVDFSLWDLIKDSHNFIWICTTFSIILFVFFAEDSDKPSKTKEGQDE